MARPLWKGAISFGLVTIPVSLYPTKDTSGDLAFHLLHKDDLSRVHNRRVDEEEHDVPYEDIVKGYEYEKGKYVVIGEADLEAANVEATQTIDIMHFVDGHAIDITYYDTPYYTEPDKAGRKAYALLRETLRKAGKVGLAKIVIRERQHLCTLIPDGPALLAYTLRWPYQLREASDFDLPSESLEFNPQELKMAEQLVEAMATSWDPSQYEDTYRDDLLRLIDEKVKSGRLTQVAQKPKHEPPAENVVDIMSLLKESMERRAKPATAGTDGAAGTGTRRGGTAAGTGKAAAGSDKAAEEAG